MSEDKDRIKELEERVKVLEEKLAAQEPKLEKCYHCGGSGVVAWEGTCYYCGGTGMSSYKPSTPSPPSSYDPYDSTW